MRFNEPEVLWIFKAISDRDRYRIAVDNDCISIDECIDEKNDEWDSVYYVLWYISLKGGMRI